MCSSDLANRTDIPSRTRRIAVGLQGDDRWNVRAVLTAYDATSASRNAGETALDAFANPLHAEVCHRFAIAGGEFADHFQKLAIAKGWKPRAAVAVSP